MGIVSQIWLRNYHPRWYRKYNYILGGAFDGGAQVMVLILSFAVFGAAGVQRPFPSVRNFILFLVRDSQDDLTYNTFLLFSGVGILLKEILITVMATGLWIAGDVKLYEITKVFILFSGPMSCVSARRTVSTTYYEGYD